MTSTAKAILDLIKADWLSANMTNRFVPEFSEKWFTETWNVERLVTIRGLTETHTIEDLCNAFHRVDALYQIDVWANDETDVEDMKTEVNRIVNARNDDPVTGVALIVQRQWKDNSFIEKEMYRYTLELPAVSFVSA